MLFIEHWMQWTRLRKWHRHQSFVLSHEAALRALGVTVRPFSA